MELHLTPEQEAQLARIAQHEGKPLEQLATERVLSILQDDEDFLAAVRLGLAQADAGNFVEEEETDTRVQAMLRPQ